MKEQTRITNRHIAKVLTRLSALKLPHIVQDEIKRQMWFLSEDLINMCKKEMRDGSVSNMDKAV